MTAVVALLAAPLTIVAPASAAPEDEVTINLLNINDFHGRIDDNTVAFAATLEQLRDTGGPANTLFLSAGDNIGASAFASSTAQDNPTIDVLKALDLSTSAVGNHEFDKGFDDLTGHVADRFGSDFSYLGANVYEKGTTTPALPEYDTFEVNGLTVGVIGAVTQETPSLVTPGGIADLEFGDPVEAVNRVTGRLSDGQPGNGEADVIVAEFHEGADDGDSTLEDEVAEGGAFADIVNETDAEVDAIFTGHTHQQYAWDAPVPGAAGQTRPIVQTGSYGENIGRIELTVDASDNSVVSYEKENVPRLAPEDTDGDGEIGDDEQAAFEEMLSGLVNQYDRVAAAKQIVDDALAAAAEIGNVPVGSVTADITTAYTDANGDGKLDASDDRDDRGSESTLGGLVANALRDTLASDRLGGAEIGITNPGGLRSELFFAGDTADNPDNTDGVVTYAEANGVLPFVNNLWTLTLTGEQFKTVLEQQWQPDGASRPYLQLGLSDNVTYTYDADAPKGEHITSVTVDGQPLDPAREYRIGTFSFLAQGGDNFTELTNATDVKDSGLVDREGWIDYLKNNPDLAPDFARQSVRASGLPEEIAAGDQLSFTLSELDLTSLGSPANTSVDVALEDADGQQTPLGTFDVTDGSSTIDGTVPDVAEGSYTIVATASPSGTTVRVPVTVADNRAESSVKAHATPGVEGRHGPIVLARVSSDGPRPTGTVQVLDGDTVLDTARVRKHGVTLLRVGKHALEAGRHELTVEYLGNDEVAASSTEVTVRVIGHRRS